MSTPLTKLDSYENGTQVLYFQSWWRSPLHEGFVHFLIVKGHPLSFVLTSRSDGLIVGRRFNAGAARERNPRVALATVEGGQQTSEGAANSPQFQPSLPRLGDHSPSLPALKRRPNIKPSLRDEEAFGDRAGSRRRVVHEGTANFLVCHFSTSGPKPGEDSGFIFRLCAAIRGAIRSTVSAVRA